MTNLPSLIKLDLISDRFLRGFKWSLINILFGQGLAFFLNFLAAYYLGKEKYGEYSLFLNTFIMLSNFVIVGLSTTLAKFIPEYKRNKQTIKRLISFSITISSICAIFTIILIYIHSNDFSIRFFNNIESSSLLRELVPIILILGLNLIFIGIFTGLEKFKLLTIINIIKNCIFLVLLLSSSPTDSKQILYFYAFSNVFVLFSYIAALFYCFKNYTKSDNSSIKINFLSIFYVFSFPAFLSSIVTLPITWYAQTLITRLDNGYEKLGMLYAALQWQQILLLIPTALTSVALPMLSQYSADSNNSTNFRKIFKINQFLTIYFSFPLGLLVCFLGDYILSLYGKGFSEGYSLFIMINIGISISAIGYPASSVIQAKGKMWFSVLINGFWGILLLILILVLIPYFDIYSYGIAFLISHFLLFFGSYFYLRTEIDENLIFKSVIIALFFIALSIFSIFLSPMIRVITLIPFLLVSFLLLLKLFPIPINLPSS